MTKEEAIAVFECLATEMTAILAGIPKSEAAADQIKRYIDAYDIAIDDEPIGRCKSCPLCQSDKIRHKQESVHNDPLVLDELRQMRGEPVWCKELECYGIVKMEKVGSWANELFLVGTWHNGDAAVNFEYDIKSRGLTLYRHKPEEGAV